VDGPTENGEGMGNCIVVVGEVVDESIEEVKRRCRFCTLSTNR
jgi:hypothetical protein